MDDQQNELVTVAMQIILHAGDARILANEALTYAKQYDFEHAELKIKEADDAIVLAHKSQTDVIQAEMSGEHYEYSMLFAHAQDTLMTIMSELNMTKEMIDILKLVSSK